MYIVTPTDFIWQLQYITSSSLKMQFTSNILFLFAAVSASAVPAALQVREAAAADDTHLKEVVTLACNTASEIITGQLAEISKLKAKNIAIPPYLAGYYSAIDSGRQEIGCPGSIAITARDVTTLKEPCEVINSQYERMNTLVNRFTTNEISVAPWIAGFLSAVMDGHKGLKCPAFTETATEAGQSSTSSATDSTPSPTAGSKSASKEGSKQESS